MYSLFITFVVDKSPILLCFVLVAWGTAFLLEASWSVPKECLIWKCLPVCLMGSLGLAPSVRLQFPFVNTVCSDVPSSACRNRTQFVLCVFMEMISAKGNALQRTQRWYHAYIYMYVLYIHTKIHRHLNALSKVTVVCWLGVWIYIC